LRRINNNALPSATRALPVERRLEKDKDKDKEKEKEKESEKEKRYNEKGEHRLPILDSLGAAAEAISGQQSQAEEK